MSRLLHKLGGRRFAVALWVAFHAVILCFFLRSIRGGLTMDADLFSMMPDSTTNRAFNEANRRHTQNSTQSIFILSGNEDFAVAKRNAQLLYERLLPEEDLFDALSLYSDAGTLREVEAFVHGHRFNLLAEQDADAILSTEDGAARFAEGALATAYGAFTLTSLENLESDPFLLDETILGTYLAALRDSGTAMGTKDGVLASKHDGVWYVLVRGTLSKKGAALASTGNAVHAIYETCAELERTEDGCRYVFFGTPFHSYESSLSAMREITLITVVSVALILLLLLFIFRSPLPIVTSVACVAVSAGTAFAATHAVFGSMQAIALVFGTSLIGSCIDYSLHFFISWKASTSLGSGAQVRAHLFRGLVLSLASTEVCYLLLFFAPFSLLRQVAVFSFTGILSSFLSVTCLYPLLPLPAPQKRRIPLLERFPLVRARRLGVLVPACIAAVALLVLGVCHSRFRLQNDISNLYHVKGHLAQDTVLAYQVLGTSPSSWFIVRGDTPDAVLEREEALRAELASRGYPGCIATSRFVPSAAVQQKSRAACGRLLERAEEQFELLGLPEELADDVRAQFAQGGIPLAPGALLEPGAGVPELVRSLLSMLWLGQVDGAWYSVVMPSVVPQDGSFAAIAQGDPDVFFEDKVQGISATLDSLSRLILLLCGAALVIIACVLSRFYPFAQTLRIVSIPLLCALVTAAVFALLDTPVEFFCLTGMVLVFGLGLDYIIYMMENRRRMAGKSSLPQAELKLEPFAIALSFLTTVLSFGALALSSFVPVHVIGLSTLVGLITAFVCTLF